MAVGIAMIPLLIHSLGGQGFAAWAILLSCSAVFNELQMGMHSALVRDVAVANRRAPEDIARLWASAVAFLVAIHAAALPLVLAAAGHVAEWLRLPTVGRWHPGIALMVVYVSVAARSALITGNFVLFAAARFYQAAAISLAQAFVSNATATLVALLTRDLAATLVAFWAAQLVVVGIGFVVARNAGWKLRSSLVDVGLIRRLLQYGVRVQLSEWAQIINFQFDKFVVVRVLGLWPAALYEVSNRSVLALRSIPASGMETFLPVATGASAGEDVIAGARRMARLAVYGILLFFAAPLAVGPVFLYAWVGEMGYVSRHVFAFLVVGAAANLLVLPLSTLAQAAGRPQVQARAAIASILLNVPLSLTLVRLWGVEGAALGSSLAMVVGMAVLLREASKALGRDVVSVVTRTLVRHWPLALVCVVWGVAVRVGFDRWLNATSIPVRYLRSQRAVAGVVALGLYAGCVVTLVLFKRNLLGLDHDERELVARLAAMVPGSARAPARREPAEGVAAGSRSPPPDAPA
jgi:O-antigen/teichoic acid export membrane protein